MASTELEKVNTSATEIEKWDKFRRMLQAKVDGDNWETIANNFGYGSWYTARQFVVRWLEKHTNPNVELIRETINGRLEILFNQYWQLALQGDIRAGEFILKILDRMAKTNNVQQIKVEQNNTVNEIQIFLPEKMQMHDYQINEGQVIDGEISDA